MPFKAKVSGVRVQELKQSDALALAENIRGERLPSTPEMGTMMGRLGGNPLMLETSVPELERLSPSQMADGLRVGDIVVSDPLRAARLTNALNTGFVLCHTRSRRG